MAWVAACGAGLAALLALRPRTAISDLGRRSAEVGPLVHRRRPGRAADDPGVAATLNRVVAGAAVLLGLVVLGPVLAVAGVVAGLLVRAGMVRAARRRRLGALERAVPDLIDLFRIAVGAGLPVGSALVAVAARAPTPTQAPLRAAVRRVERGASLVVEVHRAGSELGQLGPALADALVAGATSGAPLAPALERLAGAARDRRRRSAEQAARRLPITLLFPLVLCVLPAFGLLAVVPLLVGSLSSLQV